MGMLLLAEEYTRVSRVFGLKRGVLLQTLSE
jgi:hypothetical protein